MRLPSVLYLLPSVVPRPQSPPPLAGDAESFARLVSPAPVALCPPQLTSAVLTPLPARAVSSASAFDISVLPGSAVSSAPDSPNGVTPGTFHSRDTTPDPLGVCQGLIEDLDITGLGVRITLYMTSILTVINACIPGSNGRGSAWANLFTFIALMISAIVQTANNSISLYNAMIVLFLGYLYSSCAVAVFFLSQKEKWTLVSVCKRLAFTLPCLFWYGFGFYVWVHARSFGSQPECNAATKLIFFGREHSATGSGRVLSLVFINVQSLVFMMTGLLIGGLVACFFWVIEIFTYSLSSSPDAPAIATVAGVVLACIVQWIYVMFTIEQTIQRNPVIRSGPRFPRTFGQIFPVVTIGACLVSIYNDLREARKVRREARKAQREAQQEAQREARRQPLISQGNDLNDLILQLRQ